MLLRASPPLRNKLQKLKDALVEHILTAHLDLAEIGGRGDRDGMGEGRKKKCCSNGILPNSFQYQGLKLLSYMYKGCIKG